MKVIDVIIMLRKMPLNVEVMVDMTGDNAEVFKLKSIEGCDEIETAAGEKVVLLHCGLDEYEQSNN
jgi:hypothetical protein